MSVLGKFHEITFYGLISSIVALVCDKLSLDRWADASIHVAPGFLGFFISFLFWASILFIPIGIIDAFFTKYSDHGEGLSFNSNHLLIIFFAHIGEEIAGLFCSPFWFLRDVFTKNWNAGKILDYSLYFIELVFMVTGMLKLFA